MPRTFLMTKRLTSARDYWRAAFHYQPRYRTRVLPLLADRLSPTFILEQFPLGHAGVAELGRGQDLAEAQANSDPNTNDNTVAAVIALENDEAELGAAIQVAQLWNEGSLTL